MRRFLVLLCASLNLFHYSLIVLAQTTTQDRKQIYIDSVFADFTREDDTSNATVIVVAGPCNCGEETELIPPAAGTTYQQVGLRGPITLWALLQDEATTPSLPENTIDNLLCRVLCDRRTTGDFDLAQLVRILYLSSSNNNATRLPNDIFDRIQQTLFVDGQLALWLVPSETRNVYWSENHMIFWLSSAFLLQQFEDANNSVDPALKDLLLHYLDTKIEYGFYEFFSTNYNPFTLAALLNLVDFASRSTHPIIVTKAELVATRLLEEWLLLVNDEGYFYPAAGRNFDHRYQTDTFLSMVWFLTGKKGPLTGKPWSDDFVGAYMATTKMDFQAIADTWTATMDTRLEIGLTNMSQLDTVHGNLALVDRVMFQVRTGNQ